MPQRPASTAPFWDGVARGELLMQWCNQCNRYQWTPLLACTACLSENLGWRRVSGQGSVYSYSVVWRAQSNAFEAPYIVAIIELAEGPRILSTIVDTVADEVSIGLPVAVRFDGNGRYPFVPATDNTFERG